MADLPPKTIVQLTETTVQEVESYINSQEMSSGELEDLLEAEKAGKDRETAKKIIEREFEKKRLEEEIEDAETGIMKIKDAITDVRDLESIREVGESSGLDREDLLKAVGGTVGELEGFLKQRSLDESDLEELLDAETLVKNRKTARQLIEAEIENVKVGEDLDKADSDVSNLEGDLEELEKDLEEVETREEIDTSEAEDQGYQGENEKSSASKEEDDLEGLKDAIEEETDNGQEEDEKLSGINGEIEKTDGSSQLNSSPEQSYEDWFGKLEDDESDIKFESAALEDEEDSLEDALREESKKNDDGLKPEDLREIEEMEEPENQVGLSNHRKNSAPGSEIQNGLEEEPEKIRESQGSESPVAESLDSGGLSSEPENLADEPGLERVQDRSSGSRAGQLQTRANPEPENSQTPQIESKIEPSTQPPSEPAEPGGGENEFSDSEPDKGLSEKEEEVIENLNAKIDSGGFEGETGSGEDDSGETLDGGEGESEDELEKNKEDEVEGKEVDEEDEETEEKESLELDQKREIAKTLDMALDDENLENTSLGDLRKIQSQYKDRKMMVNDLKAAGFEEEVLKDASLHDLRKLTREVEEKEKEKKQIEKEAQEDLEMLKGVSTEKEDGNKTDDDEGGNRFDSIKNTKNRILSLVNRNKGEISEGKMNGKSLEETLDSYRDLEGREAAIKTAHIMKGFLEQELKIEREMTYKELANYMRKNLDDEALMEIADFYSQLHEDEYTGNVTVENVDGLIDMCQHAVELLN